MTLARLDRYEQSRVGQCGHRAVVVGGSMAGLCAARVLSDAFTEVVVLERDRLPSEPVARDGAPQTSQPHAMLEAGRLTLNDLFPGFDREVRALGGLKLNMAEAVDWYDRGGVVADADADLPALYASRPLFEHVVRERLRDRDGIVLRDDCHFIGCEHDAAAGRITGVRFRDGGAETTLDAQLTVDATGRTSRTPTWLADHGYPTPEVERVTVDITYSTVRITRPPERQRAVLIAPEPARPRGAAMVPVEGNRWEVVLQGLHGERSPVDRETFLDWAAALPLDAVADRLRSQEWVSDIQRYPFPASIRRRYDTLSAFPDGLAVTGDAIASFNPVYGQGMSVAALDALALHLELPDGIDGLGLRLFDRVGPIVDEAWQTAVRNDFVFEATTGPKPFGTALLNRYMDRLVTRAQDDGELTEAFQRVFRLERPSTSLLHPRILWRVFRPRLGSETEQSTT
ncbi:MULTISPECIES: NAD(P)/FAD-dependent oxidoreductase [Haloarcula]|uniref:NAD(P)/FAD-dependent oxidoreductase n=1 Tax=Haloarcula TaxID=2237 RepID=UPI0023E7AA03|nr:FAD-dependent monooxygenase [Halomicroarcula sp. SHR3]